MTKNFATYGSALVLGGVDKKYAASEFKYYPVISKMRWDIDIKLKAGNTTIKGVGSGMLDSGSTGIFMATKFYN